MVQFISEKATKLIAGIQRNEWTALFGVLTIQGGNGKESRQKERYFPVMLRMRGAQPSKCVFDKSLRNSDQNPPICPSDEIGRLV